MRKMGIAALGPRPNTTRPAGPQDLSLSVAQLDDRPAKPGIIGGRHHVSAHRPRLSVSRRHHRLGEPCGSGAAVVEHGGRLFCVAALEEALANYGTPEIFNTDQGSHFTSAAFTGALAGAGIKISMDGRGRWMDNVFIERLWRSLKHEDIDLKGYADGREAKAGVASWITFCNDPPPSGARLSHTDGRLARTDAGREGCGHGGQR
ncbi:hypothetical protein ACVWZM_004770 [Bradyrhizobium sp. USDA 4501]